ncbi:apoptosis-associated speck-like protein containing a CARD [Anarrhichthys ocellatus]|uniref:apoptosis-associated speck-like protein containing a CARD n=1 Tax=Anarrhichthys ocellatus TaxID=433405 RepID=UPI0012ED6EDB|nr:apoptosis-associated speck-like protein containing a CARD [Anarrhichthys ocellatus]
MAPKTAKQLIKGALANLSKENFELFCDELLDREEEPLVKRNQVEDKNYIVVTDVLVSTFTGTRAPVEVVKLLIKIGCHKEAEQLDKEINGQSSNPGSSDTVRPSAGAEGGCTGADFVDEHWVKLIGRVNGIPSILDELLDKKVITQEAYEEILAIPTKSDRMRKLLSGPLRSAGPKGKEVFYKILERTDPYLVDELKKKK